MATKNFRVKNGIETPLIADDAGTTAITLSGANATVIGDITLGGNDIKSNGGTTAITLNGSSATVAGSLTVSGGVISGPGSGGDLILNNASTIVFTNDYTQMQTDAGTTKAYYNNLGGKFTFNGTDGDNTGNYNLYSHGTIGSLGNTTVGGTLFLKGSTSGSVGLKGAAAAGSTTYTLPSADGTSGQVLSTNGTGTLSWVTGGGGGSTSPAGSDTEIQFNNSGSFGASSSLTWDGTTMKATQLESTNSSGDEGGEIKLNKATTNTTLTTGVTIDVYQNKLRFFETGGSNRGAFLDLSKASNSVATNLAPIPIVNSGTISARPYSLGPGVMAMNGTFATLSADMTQTIRYQPIYVTETCTLTEVAVWQQTGTSLASCNAMIYIEECSPNSATEWQPTGHLSGGYCGELTFSTTGSPVLKNITGLSITLQPGAYLIAMQISNYTGTLGLRYLAGQISIGGGYVVDLASGTTSAQASFGRTGVTYVSGTPAAVGDFSNITPNNLLGVGYFVMSKFAKA